MRTGQNSPSVNATLGGSWPSCHLGTVLDRCGRRHVLIGRVDSRTRGSRAQQKPAVAAVCHGPAALPRRDELLDASNTTR